MESHSTVLFYFNVRFLFFGLFFFLPDATNITQRSEKDDIRDIIVVDVGPGTSGFSACSSLISLSDWSTSCVKH